MRKIITSDEAADILTTVLESEYTSSWAMIHDYERRGDELGDDLRGLDVLSITTVDAGDDYAIWDGTKLAPKHKVNTGTIIAAWRKLWKMESDGKCPVAPWMMRQFHEDAKDVGDAGMIDATAADIIFQIAVLGDVVYG